MGIMDLFRKKTSSDIAKDRLKLLLVSDRANCSPETMELIKNDIIKEKVTEFSNIDIKQFLSINNEKILEYIKWMMF